MTPKFELGRDFCTVHLPRRFHHPMFTHLEVIMLTNKQTNTHTNKQTSNALCYATTLGKNILNDTDSTTYTTTYNGTVGRYKQVHVSLKLHMFDLLWICCTTNLIKFKTVAQQIECFAKSTTNWTTGVSTLYCICVCLKLDYNICWSHQSVWRAMHAV